MTENQQSIDELLGERQKEKMRIYAVVEVPRTEYCNECSFYSAKSFGAGGRCFLFNKHLQPAGWGDGYTSKKCEECLASTKAEVTL